MLAVSTYTFGQTRKSPQPTHVQSSSSRTPRTGSSRRTSGDKNAPRSRHAPKADRSKPTSARQPLSLPDYQEREQHAGPDEVRKPVQEGTRPQERVIPEEPKTLGEPRAQWREV